MPPSGHIQLSPPGYRAKGTSRSGSFAEKRRKTPPDCLDRLAGDSINGDQEALRELCEHLVRIGKVVSRRYVRIGNIRGLQWEDLVQEAVTYILEGMHRWKGERPFQAYAFYLAKMGCLRAIDAGSLVSIHPSYVQNVNKLYNQLERRYGPDEARKKLPKEARKNPSMNTYSEKSVMAVLNVIQNLPLDIDAPTGEEPTETLEAFIDSHARDLFDALDRLEVERLLFTARLNSNERRVVRLRYGFEGRGTSEGQKGVPQSGAEMSFGQIAALLDVNQQSASNFHKRAMNKLMKAIHGSAA